MAQAVALLHDPQQIQALAAPLRVELLDALREPDSAAGVARRIGKSRQSVNYHLKTLDRAGLVERAGERRRGNFVEQLYVARARRFVVAADLGWDRGRLEAAFRDQVSLRGLAALGERLQLDATHWLDRAAFEGAEVATATALAEVRFGDESARAAFLKEYLAALRPLLAKYGSDAGAPYRIALAAWPDPSEDER